MQLHPRHRCTPGAWPKPLHWEGAVVAAGQAQRLRALAALAEEAAAECAGGAADAGPGERWRAALVPNGLAVEVAGGNALTVPLLFGEVADAPVGDGSGRFVIALAPPRAAPRGAGLRAPAGPACAVWLLVSEGGEAEARRHLRGLGERGAVRGDAREDFRVVAEPLASGASASVHEARWLDDQHGGCAAQRRLAAKVLPFGGDAKRQAEMVDAEVASLALVQGHPNVIRLRGLFACEGERRDEGGAEEEAAGPACPRGKVILTDLCPRGDLSRRVSRGGAYNEAEALKLVQQVLSALAHCHSLGLVHRDVKSKNILIGDDGRALLADFGLAVRLANGKAMTRRCGTPGYAAPEVLAGSRYGRKVDTFGTGVVLYFALSGQIPFAPPGAEKDVQAIIRRTLECHISFPADSKVGHQVKQFIRILLWRDPEDRPSAWCAEDFTRALRLGPAVGDREAPGADTASTTRRQPGCFSLQRLWAGGQRRDTVVREASPPGDSISLSKASRSSQGSDAGGRRPCRSASQHGSHDSFGPAGGACERRWDWQVRGAAWEPRASPADGAIYTAEHSWSSARGERRDTEEREASPSADRFARSEESRSSQGGDAGGRRPCSSSSEDSYDSLGPVVGEPQVRGAARKPRAVTYAAERSSWNTVNADTDQRTRLQHLGLSVLHRGGSASERRERRAVSEAGAGAATDARHTLEGSRGTGGSGDPGGRTKARSLSATSSSATATRAPQTSSSSSSMPSGAAGSRPPQSAGSRRGLFQWLAPSRGRANTSFDPVMPFEGGFGSEGHQ